MDDGRDLHDSGDTVRRIDGTPPPVGEDRDDGPRQRRMIETRTDFELAPRQNGLAAAHARDDRFDGLDDRISQAEARCFDLQQELGFAVERAGLLKAADASATQADLSKLGVLEDVLAQFEGVLERLGKVDQEERQMLVAAVEAANSRVMQAVVENERLAERAGRVDDLEAAVETLSAQLGEAGIRIAQLQSDIPLMIDAVLERPLRELAVLQASNAALQDERDRLAVRAVPPPPPGPSDDVERLRASLSRQVQVLELELAPLRAQIQAYAERCQQLDQFNIRSQEERDLLLARLVAVENEQQRFLAQLSLDGGPLALRAVLPLARLFRRLSSGIRRFA